MDFGTPEEEVTEEVAEEETVVEDTPEPEPVIEEEPEAIIEEVEEQQEEKRSAARIEAEPNQLQPTIQKQGVDERQEAEPSEIFEKP